jgi:hypothetical protein
VQTIRKGAKSYLRWLRLKIFGFGTLLFRMVGSNNDISVFQRSPVFTRLAEGHAPTVQYEVSGHLYDKGHYLAHDIYLAWFTLVKTIRLHANDAETSINIQ